MDEPLLVRALDGQLCSRDLPLLAPVGQQLFTQARWLRVQRRIAALPDQPAMECLPPSLRSQPFTIDCLALCSPAACMFESLRHDAASLVSHLCDDVVTLIVWQCSLFDEAIQLATALNSSEASEYARLLMHSVLLSRPTVGWCVPRARARARLTQLFFSLFFLSARLSPTGMFTVTYVDAERGSNWQNSDCSSPSPRRSVVRRSTSRSSGHTAAGFTR